MSEERDVVRETGYKPHPEQSRARIQCESSLIRAMKRKTDLDGVSGEEA